MDDISTLEDVTGIIRLLGPGNSSVLSRGQSKSKFRSLEEEISLSPSAHFTREPIHQETLTIACGEISLDQHCGDFSENQADR